jgi:hypothetical protein
VPKRPLIITVISLCYLIAPAAIIIQGSFVSRIPLFGPHNIFTRLYYTDIIILCLYPVCSIGLYSVRKWGWWVFLGSSGALIVYNVVVYLISPMYNIVLLIMFNVGLAVVAGIFFRKHIIAPYFNPRLRWWESDPRYRLDIAAYITVGDKHIEGEVMDISESGCLIALDKTLVLGNIYTISMRCVGHRIDLKGKAMRRSSTGEGSSRYGMMFVKREKDQKRHLDALIRDLERGGIRDRLREEKTGLALSSEKRTMTRFQKTAPRYTLHHFAAVKDGTNSAQCAISDLSKRGCFLRSDRRLTIGGIYPLKITCMNSEIDISGKVIWKSDNTSGGYGVEFSHLTKNERTRLRLLLRQLKKTGFQTRMNGSRSAEEGVFEKSVVNTPYKIVLLLKKVLMRDMKK